SATSLLLFCATLLSFKYLSNLLPNNVSGLRNSSIFLSLIHFAVFLSMTVLKSSIVYPSFILALITLRFNLAVCLYFLPVFSLRQSIISLYGVRVGFPDLLLSTVCSSTVSSTVNETEETSLSLLKFVWFRFLSLLRMDSDNLSIFTL